MPDLCPPIKRLSFSLLMTLTIISLLSSCGEEKDPVALLPPVITAYQPSSAFNNESIVITGENFGTAINDVEVFFFEDARATITAISNTSLTVTIPDNAYVGEIKVKIKNQKTTGATFTVMTICSIFTGDRFSPIPCPRTKPTGSNL
ncbi:MAG: hypothetical protein EBR30_23105 [Cytophagia bacterium]|nr:hypothetical protein [Cytophagia bacterium]NBW37852.1 hypothetical protein [Cytophagia bacterium]